MCVCGGVGGGGGGGVVDSDAYSSVRVFGDLLIQTNDEISLPTSSFVSDWTMDSAECRTVFFFLLFRQPAT